MWPRELSDNYKAAIYILLQHWSKEVDISMRLNLNMIFQNIVKCRYKFPEVATSSLDHHLLA